ncbi:MAG: response regulator [Elusimicrobiota bacterium]|nr:MAG: response regulator [Elusimicrobiota bacterium]
MMPGLDGFGVLERLGRERQGLPVILVTGYPSDDSAARARALGAVDYVAKPYDVIALCAALERLAAQRRSSRS